MRASVLALLLISMMSRAEDTLPAGLLEFLGAMVEQDGELVDPLVLGIEAIDRYPADAELDSATAVFGEGDEGSIPGDGERWPGPARAADPAQRLEPEIEADEILEPGLKRDDEQEHE